MTTMTMLDLRKNSDVLLEKLRKKEKITLSYRGKPIATIQPILDKQDWSEDCFVDFIKESSHSKKDLNTTKITNKEIDSLVYGI